MKMRGIHVVIIHKMAKDFSVCGIHKYTLKEKHKTIKILLSKEKTNTFVNVNAYKKQ